MPVVFPTCPRDGMRVTRRAQVDPTAEHARIGKSKKCLVNFYPFRRRQGSSHINLFPAIIETI